MKEIIIGLLGGGAIVEGMNLLFTYRQSRRQLNASALGTEVEALERTIAVLSGNFERQAQMHRSEVSALREEIEMLRASRHELQKEVERLSEEIRQLKRESE